MKILLFGVILGLLVFVHSTPAPTVTRTSAKSEDEVLREALTDGFLVKLTSLTTESPKRNSTLPASPQPSKAPSGDFEGSGMGGFNQPEGEHYATTTQSVSHAPSSSSTVFTRDTGNPSSNSSTTESPGESIDVIPQHEGENMVTTTQSVSHGQSSTTTVPPRGANDAGSDSSTTQAPGESSNLTPSHDSENIPATTQSVSHAPSSTSTVFLRAVDHSISDSSIKHRDNITTTTQSVSHAPSSTSTVFLRAVDHSISDSSITQSTQSSLTSSTVPDEAQPSLDYTSTTLKTHHFVPSFDSSGSGSGSGEGEMPDQYTTPSITTTTNAVTTTASSTIAVPIKPIAPRMFPKSNELPSIKDLEEKPGVIRVTSEPQLPTSITDNKNKSGMTGPLIPKPEPSKGHNTPGWMIIVGFIVGVAALVVLCIAIATRDKWNGPRKASQVENQVNSANQQREQESETFLPKENGKAAEYTVIPLDELPEKYSTD
ncbi:uncharacterized serine-rich protein C215.13 [Cheilinus undulatus]|uniref:uncharacterized serine-rich protein C215.13 n=1 Tax=Cheilinus undulatus TaxID=241271 RepID=UPI001BD2C3B1|nr:uncharacterized serine-rich protein C215.13 [Cheilinus undulatus]